MPLSIAALHGLLGLGPDSPVLASTLSQLFGAAAEADIKAYPDATYHNYYSLGVSLCFVPAAGPGSALVLDSIDLLNPPRSVPGRKPPKGPQYAAPPTPLVLHFAEREITLPPRKEGDKEIKMPRPERLEVELATTGRDIVRCLGEPARKGSGSWVGVWLEWASVGLVDDTDKRVDVGIMMHLDDPKGAEELTPEQKLKGVGGVWDRAAGWRWASIKVFRPTK